MRQKSKLFISTIFIVIIGVIGGCTPEVNNPSNKKSTKQSSSRSPGSSGNTGASARADQVPLGQEQTDELYWYHKGTKIADKVTIDADAATSVYLRGKDVEEFLNSSFHKKETDEALTTGAAYCMVFHFQGIGDIVQFRVRATPTHFNNFTLGRIEKLLRVDLPEKKTNDQYCQGDVEGISAEESIALSLDQICPNCTNFFSSYKITFHESNNTSITNSIVPVNFF